MRELATCELVMIFNLGSQGTLVVILVFQVMVVWKFMFNDRGIIKRIANRNRDLSLVTALPVSVSQSVKHSNEAAQRRGAVGWLRHDEDT